MEKEKFFTIPKIFEWEIGLVKKLEEKKVNKIFRRKFGSNRKREKVRSNFFGRKVGKSDLVLDDKFGKIDF